MWSPFSWKLQFKCWNLFRNCINKVFQLYGSLDLNTCFSWFNWCKSSLNSIRRITERSEHLLITRCLCFSNNTWRTKRSKSFKMRKNTRKEILFNNNLESISFNNFTVHKFIVRILYLAISYFSLKTPIYLSISEFLIAEKDSNGFRRFWIPLLSAYSYHSLL